MRSHPYAKTKWHRAPNGFMYRFAMTVIGDRFTLYIDGHIVSLKEWFEKGGSPWPQNLKLDL